jgi:hypothetical protein
LDVRRILLIKDTVLAEGGQPALAPVTRVAACAVIGNPLAGRAEDNLEALIPLGAELGERLVQEALSVLSRPVVSYGKAAIVGSSGDISAWPPRSFTHAWASRCAPRSAAARR